MSHLPFGAFNPRFHGVSLFVTAERMGRIAGYEAVADPSSWAARSDALSLEEISTISVLDHERRHFHDFLVSPFGAVMMGMRMQASLAGLQAIKLLKQCVGKWVPAPIGRWIHWDDRQRRDWISTTGEAYGFTLGDVVALPHHPENAPAPHKSGIHAVADDLPVEEQLAQYALAATSGYRFMEVLRTKRVDGFGITIAADSVFEATAHLVQSQAIYTGQSAQASRLFEEFIANSDLSHLQALNTMALALHRATGDVSAERICELFTWMMLGPPDKVLSSGHPAARCGGVLTLLAQQPKNAVFRARAPTTAIFDALDRIFGEADWRSNVAAASAASDRRMAKFDRAAERLDGGYFDSLFAVARHWHSDQSASRSAFVEEPGSLSKPLRYVEESAYPAPFLEVRLPAGVHQRSKPVRSERMRAVAVDAEGLQAIGYTCQPPGSHPDGLLDATHNARITTHVMDLVFQDEPVADAYDKYWRDVLAGMIGKRVASLI
ncbi:MAG: hypothetical protein HZC37_01660 [Burkholderiales bacterium]|nr:hypothetical protein [Burkholderiales bacterium]